ncbi:MAG: hypothetical protein ACI9DH_001541 [Halioglobus sp.]|jgi:hypothetical protein
MVITTRALSILLAIFSGMLLGAFWYSPIDLHRE